MFFFYFYDVAKFLVAFLFVGENFLNATDLSVRQTNLDAVRVKFRVGQQVFDNADGLFAGALVLFEDDRDA